MNLFYAISMMFIGSILIHYFMMSYIMVEKNIDIRNSIGKLYMSISMAIMMVILEIMMYDIYHRTFHYIYYVIFLIILLIVIIFIKYQIFIDDKNYLNEMIQHHSMAVLTSGKILNKTKNKKVKDFASNIYKIQREEINKMNNMIKEL